MKRVTASEARRRWFSLLDEVANGEVVAIIRKGTRIVLRREKAARAVAEPPDYRRILRVKNADNADSWSWEWSDSGVALRDASDK
jgi:antitoxin (DNA-binding transcriptional repressor) of toxin-antitoxin stability system